MPYLFRKMNSWILYLTNTDHLKLKVKPEQVYLLESTHKKASKEA